MANSDSRRRRTASVLSRIIAAALGGYGFTYAATAALAVLLPTARADAVLVASMLSFAIYLTAILFSFAARDLWRVWSCLLVSALALTAIGFWPLLRGML